ncbi:MAG: F0F1 ATP synthase subunit alpha, partial [bacterium]
QYRELEAFAKFGSDLDAATKAVLDKGSRNVEVLKQGQFSPVPVEKQVAILYCGTNGLLRSIPVNKVREFEARYLEYLDAKHRDTLDLIKAGKIDEQITSVLEAACKEIAKDFQNA